MQRSCAPSSALRQPFSNATACCISPAFSPALPPCRLGPPAGCKEVQVRLLARGDETVLGDAASDSEVFLTTKLETR